jgi:2-oxoglutarate dehydrogenase E1 component
MIGFTALPPTLYSGRYATEIAKRLPIPIFHVNAESPDDVCRTGSLALDYRVEFSSDVVIDCIGYRRFGHSEIDDPTTTAPLLYQNIQSRPFLFQAYAEQIGISDENIEQLEESAKSLLETGLAKGRALTQKPKLVKLPNYWEPYFGGLYSSTYEVQTSVELDRLCLLHDRITDIPADFSVHPKLGKILTQRREMLEGKHNLDWGAAESLAFASLLDEGIPIRLSGQDSRRGTFNHRHAVLYDTTSGKEWIPLANLRPGQGHFGVYDSMLSEAAVLGFEYGFSRDFPEALVCWEAQFGDFANGAQIIIDQFISAGEEKWGLLSGLVMLLPHGYEGQGPEHSSARIERFLQAAAHDNMQICQPSTAAQHFHLLRRQALRHWRKPLIVFTPKSMLRAASACSPLPAFTHGSFQTILDDDSAYTRASRLIMCSGKIVHELKAERSKREDTDVAIVSVEQLHPFPEEAMVRLLNKYERANTIVWVQEEPANQGAKYYIQPEIQRLARGRKVTAVRRSAAASPATGSQKAHELEQQAILRLAFMRYT